VERAIQAVPGAPILVYAHILPLRFVRNQSLTECSLNPLSSDEVLDAAPGSITAERRQELHTAYRYRGKKQHVDRTGVEGARANVTVAPTETRTLSSGEEGFKVEMEGKADAGSSPTQIVRAIL
jgi:hypothetical protein